MATLAELAMQGGGKGRVNPRTNPMQGALGNQGAYNAAQAAYMSPEATKALGLRGADRQAQMQANGLARSLNHYYTTPGNIAAGNVPSWFQNTGQPGALSPNFKPQGGPGGSLNMDPNAGAQDFNGVPGFNMPLWTGDTTNFGQTQGWYVPGTEYGPGTQAAINGYMAQQYTAGPGRIGSQQGSVYTPWGGVYNAFQHQYYDPTGNPISGPYQSTTQSSANPLGYPKMPV